MKIVIFLFLFSYITTLNAASTHLVILGGGGEPLTNSETMFDQSLKNLKSFYQENKEDYQGIVSFNGGHQVTDKIISEGFAGADIREGFTPKNFHGVVTDLINKLSATPPVIPKNGKILLFINGHGSRKNSQTHRISTTGSVVKNYNSESANSVSLDRLIKLSELAKKTGVKLGVIDGTCHAGTTLLVANSHTCVIAASGPDQYAFKDFAENFSAKMKKGKSLEDVYFEARNTSEGASFPMISTEAGILVQNELYPLLVPYLYSHDEYRGIPMDKLDYFLRENSATDLLCKRERQFESLEKLLSSIESLNNVVQTLKVDATALKDKIGEYKKFQDFYLEKLNKLDLSKLNKKEDVKTDALPFGNSYTHQELLMTNYTVLVEEKKQLLLNPNLSAKQKKDLEELREFYMAAQLVKEKVLKNNPQYTEQEKILNTLVVYDNYTSQMTSEIGKEARAIYNAYYKQKSDEMKSVENPCKDFVL